MSAEGEVYRCGRCREQPTAYQRRQLCAIARAHGCRFVSADGPESMEHESWFEWTSRGEELDGARALSIARAVFDAGLSCQLRGRRPHR